MTAAVVELGLEGSRSTVFALDPSQGGQKRVFSVTNETDPDNVHAAVIAAPGYASSVDIDGRSYYPTTFNHERLGKDVWRSTVDYKAFEFPPVNEIEVEFDTDGGSARVTQALSHIGDYVASGTAPNYNGAINVTDDGVDGVDIEIPAFQWSYHITLTTADLDQAWVLAVASMTKSVNSATWHGFAAGTVLFLGLRGRAKYGSTESQLEFRFRFEPVDSARTDANGISLPDRNGHDVLWYRSRDLLDANGNLVKRATSAHIDRVYRYAAFSSLGLGASWPI